MSAFQYQLINLVWLSIHFFSFNWSQSRPQSNFKKSKNSFSSSSYSVKIRWGQGWAKASLSTFSWLYILVCADVQKYHDFFLKKVFLVLILQLTCFIYITSKRKQTMEHQPYRACEWTKSNKNKKNKVKSHSNWPCILFFYLDHKQFNGIIKGWLHCATSESKGRFLANNILLTWCLVMAQIQFSLTNKIKIGRSEHSLTSPQPPYVR